ncbi:MAG: peptidase dimerization domain-containing protein [Chloroflexi bacterium]|nr:peptidase dimerization domain-containing protein [Chloroflexota bacterium]
MANQTEVEKQVLKKVEELEPELIKVALDLSTMETAQPNEKPAGDYAYAWFEENGLRPKRVGAPDRFNVLAKYEGSGKGRSLIFCSHLDGGGRFEGMEWKYRYPNAPFRLSAWREGDALVGQSIANCKGPMACWMIATKAIKESGVKLLGDILLAPVVGETGGSPVDEYKSPEHDSHELGARYLVSHGGMADYAMVAEATAFSIVPCMTGFAYYKITIYGGAASYTPFLRRPQPAMEKNQNAIVRMAKFIEKFEEYAEKYMKENTYSFDGGTMVPNAVIGGIRGGTPPKPTTTAEVCSAYCDFRVRPGKNPLDMKRDLERILEEMGTEGEVEMFKYLPGFEAWQNKGFDTFKKALVAAHQTMFQEPPRNVATQFVSMWRDVNPFNELGVPALSYGFPTGYTKEGATATMSSSAAVTVKIADMVRAAKVYALLALDLCNRPLSQPL